MSVKAQRVNVPSMFKYLSIIYFDLKSNDTIQKAISFKAKGENG